jgi:hypothetical protein
MYDNIGSMRWVDSSDATKAIGLVKTSGADFTPDYPPLDVFFSTLPVFE